MFSYRLELMRQVYNTSESPELMNYVLELPNDVTSHAPAASCELNNFIGMGLLQQQHCLSTKENINSFTTTCRNTTRLTLTNLMPSRLDLLTRKPNYTIQDKIIHLESYRIHYF